MIRATAYLIALIALPARSLAAAPIGWIEPTTQTVNVGDTFILNVFLQDVTDLAEYEFTLSFNSQFLKPVQIYDRFFLRDRPSWQFSGQVVDFEGFDIDYVLVDGYLGDESDRLDADGVGQLASLEFEALRAGTSVVAFDEFMVAADDQGGHLSAEDPSSPFHQSTVTAVAEPGSLLLLGTALLGFVCWRLRFPHRIRTLL
jgi:hypothetical protein